MPYIPHPTLPVGHLRTYDTVVLLAFGAISEFVGRCVLIVQKRKPTAVRKREAALKDLERLVVKKRALGPSAFVETSKLERQQLAEEKALGVLKEERQTKLKKLEKSARNINMMLTFLIFILWFGIPILEFSAHRLNIPVGDLLSLEESQDIAISAFKSFLFPISSVGMGIKISRLGLPSPLSSCGALLVSGIALSHVWGTTLSLNIILNN